MGDLADYRINSMLDMKTHVGRNNIKKEPQTMYNNDPLKVLTGECRLSYVHLTEPYAQQPGAEAKYSVTLLIPKSDIATKADIDSAMQAAIAEGVTKTWNGQRPAMPKIPLYDGDGVRPSGEPFGDECKGCWVITAGCKADKKPEVVHISNIHSQLSPADIYSGMYGRVTIRFFTYNNSGNRGVGCGLGNVLKTREGDPLSAGRTTAENDFATLEQAALAPGYGLPPAAPSYPAGYQAGLPSPYGLPPAAPAYGAPAPAYPAYGAQAPAAAPAYPGAVNPFTGLPM